MASIPQPCISPDGELSEYKSLLCPPKVYLYRALHIVRYLILHKLLNLLLHEEAMELQIADPAEASFLQMPTKKC